MGGKRPRRVTWHLPLWKEKASASSRLLVLLMELQQFTILLSFASLAPPDTFIRQSEKFEDELVVGLAEAI